jgi:hypothetical protein
MQRRRILSSSTFPLPLEAMNVRFKNGNSQKYMAVPESKKNPGVEIIQWQRTGNYDQLWSLESQPGGAYRIRNVNSKLSLAVNQNSTQRGTRVCQWTDTGEKGQLWTLHQMSRPDGRPNEHYKVKNLGSGLLLAVGEGKQDNGAVLCIWDDLDGDEQIWTLEQ